MDWTYGFLAALELIGLVNIVVSVRSFRRGEETVSRMVVHVLDQIIWMAIIGACLWLYWSVAHGHHVNPERVIRNGLRVLVGLAVWGVTKFVIDALTDPEEKRKVDGLVEAYENKNDDR